MTNSNSRSQPLCLIAPMVAIVSLVAVINNSDLDRSPSVVTIAFPPGSAYLLEDSVRIELKAALRRLPKVKEIVFGASQNGQAKVMVTFRPGVKSTMASLSVHQAVAGLKEKIPQLTERGGDIAHHAVTSAPMTLVITNSDRTRNEDFLYNYSLIAMLPEMDRLAGVGDTLLIGTAHRCSIWFTLDRERLRTLDLSPDDIVENAWSSNVIGSQIRLVESTPRSITHVLGNVSASLFVRPKVFENIVLKASSDGQIVRWKDVGKVEMRTLWRDHEQEEGEKAWAAIVLTPRPDTSNAEMVRNIETRLQEVKADSIPIGMTFYLNKQLSIPGNQLRSP